MQTEPRACLIAIIAALALAPSATSAATLKTIYSFCNLANCNDGAVPGTLVSDFAGHIYGVAAYGGSATGYNGRGTAFELVPTRRGKWTLGRLYVFCANGNCADGSLPQSGLIIDSSGNLYGTTAEGGTGYGNVFELVSEDAGAAWGFQTLYSFIGSDGDNPSSPLTYAGATATSYYDGKSSLFGSTLNGGKVDAGGGTVFQLNSTGNGWTLTTLHDFSSDGFSCEPNEGLLVNISGTVYGQTLHCGTSDVGYLYALSKNDDAWTESVLYKFDAVVIPTTRGARWA